VRPPQGEDRHQKTHGDQEDDSPRGAHQDSIPFIGLSLRAGRWNVNLSGAYCTCQPVDGLPSRAEPATLRPLSSHIATVPELWRHRMSALPSPLKSPTSATAQSRETSPSTPVPTTLRPL